MDRECFGVESGKFGFEDWEWNLGVDSGGQFRKKKRVIQTTAQNNNTFPRPSLVHSVDDSRNEGNDTMLCAVCCCPLHVNIVQLIVTYTWFLSILISLCRDDSGWFGVSFLLALFKF